VIAQQLAEVFPEHVETISDFDLPDQNFAISDFLQVDKVALTLDLISAMQSQHKHFSFGPNSGEKSGDITVATEAGGSYATSNPTGASGSVTISTGTASLGDSGAITLTTGRSENENKPGSIAIEVGGTDGDGPSVHMSELGVLVSAGQQTDPLEAGGRIEIAAGSTAPFNGNPSEDGGALVLLAGNSTGSGGTGGGVIVRPGRGGLLNGTAEMQSSTGEQRI
ncbi:unnamed protein product, partial [Scytosiphon promiscuus]